MGFGDYRQTRGLYVMRTVLLNLLAIPAVADGARDLHKLVAPGDIRIESFVTGEWLDRAVAARLDEACAIPVAAGLYAASDAVCAGVASASDRIGVFFASRNDAHAGVAAALAAAAHRHGPTMTLRNDPAAFTHVFYLADLALRSGRADAIVTGALDGDNYIFGAMASETAATGRASLLQIIEAATAADRRESERMVLAGRGTGAEKIEVLDARRDFFSALAALAPGAVALRSEVVGRAALAFLFAATGVRE